MLSTLGLLAQRNALIAFATISILLVFFTLRRLCRSHNFQPYRPKGNDHRKVYDLFLFSHELDWLEIRLNTLAPYVDYFVIVESPTTFTGMEKPLYLEQHWSNFTKFHNKIIHKVVRDPGPSIGTSTWIHEDYFRNSLFESTFPTLLFTDKEAHEGDVILVSDVDEIPKPVTLNVLRHCNFPDRLTLRSHFYYYSFQWLHIGEQWPHPQATVFRGLSKTLSPNELRNGIGGPSSWWPFRASLHRWWQKADMWNAAWHCSSCFATLAEMRAKMESFSHTPLNTAENRDEATMLERVRSGKDLFGREGQEYERVDNNRDVPTYVLERKAEFEYLLDRDGKNAGFRDWTAS
ncbi:glycosyltransferase family 17 protein [Zasmidium cellare ATCC 36951]|uniref:Glycosyltransferase family 17 protein n=1 Tax=Zasmidium cellare ATCC 36951 TaxID=1080233 RepID=A0A6A6CFU4_ZASCE|nr:glycosyltransferase family 17 protein [Zasmidium cellare ATCC 36951]KAF2165931.1 glycosyltransferase family 17 protein [Zasmidium cellare ATCC 36951]